MCILGQVQLVVLTLEKLAWPSSKITVNHINSYSFCHSGITTKQHFQGTFQSCAEILRLWVETSLEFRH